MVSIQILPWIVVIGRSYAGALLSNTNVGMQKYCRIPSHHVDIRMWVPQPKYSCFFHLFFFAYGMRITDLSPKAALLNLRNTGRRRCKFVQFPKKKYYD